MKLPWVLRTSMERFEIKASVETVKAHDAWVAQQVAQDKVRHLEAQVINLIERLNDAEREALRGRELVADWLAQRVFGTPIFGSGAPTLPSTPVELEAMAELGRGRMTGRDLVKEQTRKFFEEYRAQGATNAI